MQQMMDQQDQNSSTSSSSGSGSMWVAGVVGIARGLLISSAVGSFTSALSSGSAMAAVVAAVSGMAAAAASAAPVALQLTQQNASSSKRAQAVQLLALEAAWAAAMVGVAPILNFAAAAGIAATLLSLHKQVVAPQLLQYQAAAGDRFQAHISLKLHGSSIAFDTTMTNDPVALVAAQRSNEHAQNWKQLGSEAFWEKLAPQQNAAQAAADTAAAGAEGASTAAAAQLRSVAQGLCSWLGTPAARWEPLLPFVADAACGMFVGETRTLELFNPKAGGYCNPAYSWWQPTADVLAKFKGQVSRRAAELAADIPMLRPCSHSPRPVPSKAVAYPALQRGNVSLPVF
jgi:2-hydroxychromene-2-carboxylate isomerase